MVWKYFGSFDTANPQTCWPGGLSPEEIVDENQADNHGQPAACCKLYLVFQLRTAVGFSSPNSKQEVSCQLQGNEFTSWVGSERSILSIKTWCIGIPNIGCIDSTFFSIKPNTLRSKLFSLRLFPCCGSACLCSCTLFLTKPRYKDWSFEHSQLHRSIANPAWVTHHKLKF